MNRKPVQQLLPEVAHEAAQEQIRSKQREVDFDVRDFPIQYLVDQFQEGVYYVPDYQRAFIWRTHHRCRFIESVILGLPIPMMFFAEMEDGRLEIVDGAQRMQTLESFVNNDLELEKLEKLPALEGFRFCDLPIAQRRKFHDRPLRVVILDDSTSLETRKEIFKRINTSGEKARPSEVRRGAYAGPLMVFIESCARDPLFRKLCPVSESLRLRKEPEELVVRFFAYSDHYREFKHDVDRFLDNYVAKHRDTFDRSTMKCEFDRTMQFVAKFFPHGFAKGAGFGATPRVRFEAIAVGANLALRKVPGLVPKSMEWLESDEFKLHTTTHASNSTARLRKRVEYVRDQLLSADLP